MDGGAPVTENSIYGGEVYDARIESVYPLNWATADYEPTWENGWMYPLIVEAPGGVLEAQSIDEIRVCGTFPEIARTRISDTVTVIDVGQNLAGWARIRVRGERGAAVTLRYAEGLKEDGTVNQLNLRSALLFGYLHSEGRRNGGMGAPASRITASVTYRRKSAEKRSSFRLRRNTCTPTCAPRGRSSARTKR